MPGMLDGKSAIVTGGGSGIGRETALALAREGARVVVADLGASLDGTGRSSQPADETVSTIRNAGGEAMTVLMDVTNHEQSEDLVRRTIEAYGKLDIVVTVAGILRDRMVFNMTEDEWDAVVDVHLKGTFNVTKFAAIHWRTTRAGGRLITITSGSGLHGAAGQPNYAAAKMGIVGFTLSCANALKRYGVTCNSISPVARTRMTESAAQQLAGMFDWESGELEPRNVTPAIVYLASDDAGWVNGQVVRAFGYQVSLMEGYRERATIFNAGPWQPSDLARQFRKSFEPILTGSSESE